MVLATPFFFGRVNEYTRGKVVFVLIVRQIREEKSLQRRMMGLAKRCAATISYIASGSGGIEHSGVRYTSDVSWSAGQMAHMLDNGG